MPAANMVMVKRLTGMIDGLTILVGVAMVCYAAWLRSVQSGLICTGVFLISLPVVFSFLLPLLAKRGRK